MKSSHEAPKSGYLSEFIQNGERTPTTYETNYSEKNNYYFRIRSEVDENGNVISAFYGKIYGGFLHFTYYLNPDGSHNIEYDPNKNLFKDDNNKYKP